MIIKHLEELYEKLNRREYVHPDPLEVLYDYDDPADREIAGLVAASLAYGGVNLILRAVRDALSRTGPPRKFLEDSTPAKIRAAFDGFKYRFTAGESLAAMLVGARRIVRKHGSLGNCFLSLQPPDAENCIPGLRGFVAEITRQGPPELFNHLVPCPSRGSACKRLLLYLRWMSRRDDVDPGGWELDPSKLVVPLDVHMHRISSALGLTKRKGSGLATAIEVTRAFARYSPDDPVKYDFALTRLGIHPDFEPGPFLRKCVPTFLKS